MINVLQFQPFRKDRVAGMEILKPGKPLENKKSLNEPKELSRINYGRELQKFHHHL